MMSSGKQTMSASAARARSSQWMTRRVLPARWPTVGLTCASAILTPQLSLAGHPYHLEGLSYFERLRAVSRERRTLLCVGLDPDPDRIEGGVAGALRHCRAVVRATEEHVCCFKPNSALWEQYGADGWQSLLELRGDEPAAPYLIGTSV